MINDLSILQTLSGMATHASRRHGVVAENIANADTPGYKAQDVKAFADVYAQATREGRNVRELMQTTHLIEMAGVASADGNTVSLDEQMLISAQAVGQHDMALTVYKKTLDMMKMAVGKNL